MDMQNLVEISQHTPCNGSFSRTGCAEFLSNLDPSCYRPDYLSLELMSDSYVIKNDADFQLHPLKVGKNIILTCEHASNVLPVGYEWTQNDIYFSTRHNAVDIGIWLVTFDMYKKLLVPTSLAKYSRLFIDLNRSVSCKTLVVDICHGINLDLNKNKNDRDQRIKLWYNYKESIENLIHTYPNTKLCLSMHSFTPFFEWAKRDVEIGILYDENSTDMKLVETIYNLFKSHNYDIRHNEPYIGDCHRTLFDTPPAKYGSFQNKIPFLLLEIRQDLAVNKEWRTCFLSLLVPLLEDYFK